MVSKILMLFSFVLRVCPIVAGSVFVGRGIASWYQHLFGDLREPMSIYFLYGLAALLGGCLLGILFDIVAKKTSHVEKNAMGCGCAFPVFLFAFFGALSALDGFERVANNDVPDREVLVRGGLDNYVHEDKDGKRRAATWEDIKEHHVETESISDVHRVKDDAYLETILAVILFIVGWAAFIFGYWSGDAEE